MYYEIHIEAFSASGTPLGREPFGATDDPARVADLLVRAQAEADARNRQGASPGGYGAERRVHAAAARVRLT